MEQTHLLNHLAADAASRTRDEDFLSFEQIAHTLHVNLYLVAWQQVFDADFFERVHHLMRSIGIPFLHTLGHIDVHSRLDEHVLQLRVVSEHFVAQGRHQHGIDAVFAYHVDKVVVYGIHLLTHEIMIGEAVFVGDKSEEAILLRLLRRDVLSQTHAAFAHAVNQCSLRLLGIEHRIVDAFYQDAERPQQDGGDKIYRNNVPQVQRHNIFVYVCPKDDGVMDDGDKHKSHPHCIGHPLKIDKRREAYHTSIGVVHAKANDVEHLIEQQRVDDGKDVVGCALNAEKQGANEYTSNQTDEAVDEEDAPIRQRIFAEVPVNKLVKTQHTIKILFALHLFPAFQMKVEIFFDEQNI